MKTKKLQNLQPDYEHTINEILNDINFNLHPYDAQDTLGEYIKQGLQDILNALNKIIQLITPTK